jgi:hypothetical protein
MLNKLLKNMLVLNIFAIVSIVLLVPFLYLINHNTKIYPDSFYSGFIDKVNKMENIEQIRNVCIKSIQVQQLSNKSMLYSTLGLFLLPAIFLVYFIANVLRVLKARKLLKQENPDL